VNNKHSVHMTEQEANDEPSIEQPAEHHLLHDFNDKKDSNDTEDTKNETITKNMTTKQCSHKETEDPEQITR